jgi:tRNA-dihydrouridine synthase B
VTIPVIANGDMTTFADVSRCIAQSGADGVMIGRGTYGRPWFIGQIIHYLRTGAELPDPPLEQQLSILLEHYEAILEHYGTDAGVKIARKHVSWYSKGLAGSAEFRAEVNRAGDPAIVRRMIQDFYFPAIDKLAADRKAA